MTGGEGLHGLPLVLSGYGGRRAGTREAFRCLYRLRDHRNRKSDHRGKEKAGMGDEVDKSGAEKVDTHDGPWLRTAMKQLCGKTIAFALAWPDAYMAAGAGDDCPRSIDISPSGNDRYDLAHYERDMVHKTDPRP